MGNPDDAASRLSSALDEVFSDDASRLSNEESGNDESGNDGSATADRGAHDESGNDGSATADRGAHDESSDPVPAAGPDAYELPEIVPATVHIPATEELPVTQPVLPVIRSAPAGVTAPTVNPVPQPAAQPAPAATPAAGQATGQATGQAGAATSWADHMTSTPLAPQSVGLRSPGRRPRVRRVTRVLRHIDPWSTFKVALLFSTVGYVVMLTSGVLLWRVADSTGTLDNVERWFTQFGWETFELKGGEIFHNAWIIGLFGAVALTGTLVLLATLFNLVSDIVGGIRVTVLEEEVVERTVSSTRRYVVRRPPVAGDPGDRSAASDWDVDGDETPEPVQPAAPPATTESSVAASADWSVDDD